MTTEQDEQGVLPPASRNSGQPGGSILESFAYGGGEAQPHPGEALFNITEIKELLIKGDIPEKMVPLVSRMLWKAERYKVDTLQSMVEWYLYTRLGADRQSRKEYMEVVMNLRPKDDDGFGN